MLSSFHLTSLALVTWSLKMASLLATVAAAVTLSAVAYAAPDAPALADAPGGGGQRRALWNAPPVPSFSMDLTFVPPVGSISPILGAAFAIPNPSNYMVSVRGGARGREVPLKISQPTASLPTP